jgi:hypothetical protein
MKGNLVIKIIDDLEPFTGLMSSMRIVWLRLL